MISQERTSENVWEKFSSAKDINIRNDIVLRHEHLVKLVVCRLIPNYRNHADYEDFICCGTLGLMDAVEKYDYTKGVKFETYASIRIRGAIIDSIRKHDWVSSSLRQKIKKINEAFESLEYSLGRPATEEEVASYLNMDIKELRNVIMYSYTSNIIYFDQLLASSDAAESLVIDNDLPEEKYEKKELLNTLVNCINMLSTRERMVITLYYFEELNLKEIGLILGVSESRVSQIHSKTLMKLRKAISKAI